MNRNTNAHFSSIPDIEVSRSRFDRSFHHLTTCNAGRLIPIYCDEVLAGDTRSMDMACLIRMTTPVKPPMADIYADFYAFFTPSRLLWEDFKEFMGQNNSDPWSDPTEKMVPFTTPPEGGWDVGTVADYLGVPTGVDLDENSCPISLPFREYALIWNEWFRDQNVQYPVQIDYSSANSAGQNIGFDGQKSNPSYGALGGKPLPVCKFHDYFTSCLPAPQKGDAVQINLTNTAPVQVVGPSANSYFMVYDNAQVKLVNGFVFNGTDSAVDDAPFSLTLGTDGYVRSGEEGAGGIDSGYTPNAVVDIGSNNGIKNRPFYPQFQYATDVQTPVMVANLNNVTAVTINELRLAFQLQRLLERDARGGTRYREILRAHFGVTVPDSRAMIPEYIGGKRVPIRITSVPQTSSTGENSTPQGNLSAFSQTTDSDSMFTYSATEPGYIMIVMCIRYDHVYQQGIERYLTRRRRYDFYYPALANIGEQPVYRREIYATSNKTANDAIFGYQEAWADYRYKPDKVSGEFRSSYAQSLDVWHVADDYETAPTLSAEWIAETPVNLDRTLTVPSTTASQFLCDFAFYDTAVRPMPIYSVPGLIDHN